MTAATELRVRGQCVSPGRAIGPAVVVAPQRRSRVASGDPAAEAEALRRAVAATVAAIEALAEGHDAEAAEILLMQTELLRDEALLQPAFAAIAAGVAADLAWQQAMEAEIREFAAADDPVFRARATDLHDLANRTLDHLCGGEAAADIPAGAVVAADDLPPSRFLAIDWSAGGAVVLSSGSASSHVAILAKARGVPMLIGTGVAPETFRGQVLVDAQAGLAIVHAAPATLAHFRAGLADGRAGTAAVAEEARAPARSRDGHAVNVYVNVSDLGEIAGRSPETCDGIGLVRSEFLFHGDGLPDEERQYDAYVRLLAWAEGRPVTVRTVDAGGDKRIPGFDDGAESNSFLGMRGIRLSLARPATLRTQLRALLRAAAHGDLRIMLPMVTVPAELAAVRAMLDEELAGLAGAGQPARRPPLGIMVEVPATAIAIDRFDADFFSIGSNDLIQYTTAAARDIRAVAALADPRHPAVLRLLGHVAAYGTAAGREVCICGELAGDPAHIPLVLGCGLASLSVPPSALAATKCAVRAATFVPPRPWLAAGEVESG
jgi:phosphotransferase system enzyme I (PtsI)